MIPTEPRVAWHTRRYGFSTVHRRNPATGYPSCGQLPPAGARLYQVIPLTLGLCRKCYRDRRQDRPMNLPGTSEAKKAALRVLIDSETRRFHANGGTIQRVEPAFVPRLNRVRFGATGRAFEPDDDSQYVMED